MFSHVENEIVLYGHDHQRNICKDDKLYINVGSLGCPAQSRNIARAGVVSIKPENIEVQTIDEHYDASLVVEGLTGCLILMPVTSKSIFTVFGDQTVFGLTVFVKYMYSFFLKRNNGFVCRNKS